MKLLLRIQNRLGRDLVTKYNMPPSFLGYRYVKPITPRGYCQQLKTRDDSCNFHLIETDSVNYAPLPCNILDREQLSKNSSRWGFSFFDVPERKVNETFIATIPDCRILSFIDQNGDEFYAIMTGDNRNLQVRGTGYDHHMHGSLIRNVPELRLKKASWILEAWNRNCSHWILWHLPKILLLQEFGLAERIILPRQYNQTPFIEESVDLLGLRPARLHRLTKSVLYVDELTVVGIDDYRESILSKIYRKTAGGNSSVPKRKVFISRQKARWRRLENEDECWEMLKIYCYERVFMEDLSFRQQISLMNETIVIFSLHGAGLANMIFAPKGIHVIEISDPDFPNPTFYALAACLGHHYWLIQGKGVGTRNPGYHDVSIELSDLREILEKIEAVIN